MNFNHHHWLSTKGVSYLCVSTEHIWSQLSINYICWQTTLDQWVRRVANVSVWQPQLSLNFTSIHCVICQNLQNQISIFYLGGIISHNIIMICCLFCKKKKNRLPELTKFWAMFLNGANFVFFNLMLSANRAPMQAINASD